MSDVFLSYAREDRDKAAQIAEALTAGGYDVFWDVEIPPGVSWSDFLEEKLSSSKAALVLWSKTSTASQWVREEARLAKDRSKLIPVMIDDSAPPFGFGEIQAANLSTWNGEADHPQWKLLMAGVAKAVGAEPTGRAQAKPVRAASGWDSARAAGAATAPPPPADKPKKKANVPLIVGGSVLATIVVLAAIGSMTDTSTTTPPAAGVMSGPDATALAPALQAAVAEAREAQAAGRAASEEASQAVIAANRASMQASQGVNGFGQVQLDQVTTVMGDLAALQQGRAGAVVMRNSQFGTTFTGLLELDPATGMMRTLTGGTDNGRGGTGLGKVTFDGQQGVSAGRDSTPQYTAEGRGRGVAGSLETAAVGVVTYADGRRYEGAYITRGRDAVLLRHGLGVTYAADGAVGEAGRFDNDRLVAPE